MILQRLIWQGLKADSCRLNKDDELWVGSHHALVDASTDGKFVQLECGHNVYEYEAERIASDVKAFLG